ncbi:hypothetical protein QYE76_053557 [Lolium multiflorum]|uniref:Aminotransferase-like plant mobile domain-containing protein n=1 Tax=Lolium multiflorum TaxID=4521 RepID=A0AAD8SVZ6_LOLMU|nr:hypothetical protein QYE76_053557 [Lolium multiflorum]
MNAAALTALVDRWRPEMHTFHLRAGEMTPTLQDVSMILGLPIQGEPLCMNTTSDGWRRQMEDLIGMAPPPPADPKDRTPAGAPFAWIRANFGECPEGADRDTLRTYTRVYLWYTISRTLFADSGGKLAHWYWLKALTVLEYRWSWGTAALAYLYRHRSEIQKTAEECEVIWDQSHRDEKPIGPLRHFIKNTARKMRRLANLVGCRDGEIATSSSEEAEIPDDTILSQSITRGKKQATRSAYQLKPRGKAPNRYTPDDYVNRGKKVVTEKDEQPPRRSSLRRMRNHEPLSSEEEEQEEEQQQEPRQRTKRLAFRKQPVRRGRRGR